MAHTLLGPGPEFDLIRRFLAQARQAAGDVRVGPGDDAAVLSGGVVLSTDMSVEGVHFQRDWLSPAEIGWRSTAGALSDLAAMAARPVGVLASLGVPVDDAPAAVEVMRGVEECVASVGGTLLGGDLTRSPGPLILDVTVVGLTERPVLRSGALAGDELWVTGDLGGAAACVASLLGGRAPDGDARARFARPQPRTAEALWLADRGVLHALVDLSDGLAGDAAHIAAASAVAVVLDAESIPVHPAARIRGTAAQEALRLALSGGEDYEICFASPPGAIAPLGSEFLEVFGLPLTRVGLVEEGSGVAMRGPGGGRSAITRGGYQHFGVDA